MTFLSQSVTGLVDGSSYRLSLDIAAGSADNHVGASVNGFTVFTADNTSEAPSQSTWRHVWGDFVAGSTNDLVIEGFDNPDVLYIAHVSIEPVPEPASLAILAIGGGAPMRRRRNSK